MAGKIIYTRDEQEFMDSVKTNECGAVSVKRIKAFKVTPNIKSYSVELIERIPKDGVNQFNALAYFNPSNPQFTSGGGAQHHWLTVTAEFCNTVFGVDLQQLDSLQIGIGRIFIGKPNVSAHMPDGTEKFLKIQIVERLESNLTPSKIQNYLENPDAKTRDMKKAGGNGRLMKGLNADTGEIEQIYRDTVCQSALKDSEGNLINENWEHIRIDEFVEAPGVSVEPIQSAETATMAPSLD
jgi:hypothetical protein